MSMFNLHSTVVEDYRDFVRSFFFVADARAREFTERGLAELDAWFARAYRTRRLVWKRGINCHRHDNYLTRMKF